MSFHKEMKDFINDHGAINNRFLTRFREDSITVSEFRRLSVEFFHFSREWPMILATLLVNTADEAEAAELTKILVSELGDMNPSNRHELLFRRFLGSISIDPIEAMKSPKQPTTRNFLEGLQRLFSNQDHFLALGAEFGLENMAIPMWDQLILGLRLLKERSFPRMDMTFFTFHRELEETHEAAMESALGIHERDPSIRRSFGRGVKEVLDLLEAFWLGLEESPQPATVASLCPTENIV